MLGSLRRGWRAWRDKARLMAPMWVTPPGMFPATSLCFPELRDVLAAGGPELPPYAGLAEVWHEYTAPQVPNYPEFLAALARRRGSDLRDVLDLACGTGILAARLAGVAAEVVGLDESGPMLAAAGRLCDRPGVSFVPGDFRDFDLGRPFDAAVCAFNSLNYVRDLGELGRVFAAVARHLRPGGVFVFDAITDVGMRLLSGVWLHATPGGRRLAIHFTYNRAERREAAHVVLPTGIETHRRTPIDLADVVTAADGSGLAVIDQFTSAFPPGIWGQGLMAFHILERKG